MNHPHSNQRDAKPFVLRDEVHGDMTFDGLLRSVVDHRYFQRLRSIKQIGLAEYVFPCATHTRFQHSLGAAFLAGSYFESLVQAWVQQPIHIAGPSGRTRFDTEKTAMLCHEVNDDRTSYRFWSRAAVLAGLLHDCGHGPLSHTFEYLNLQQDFAEPIEQCHGVVRDFMRLRAKEGRLMHEDISVLYIGLILEDLRKAKVLGTEEAQALTLAVCGLVRRKLATGPLSKSYASELTLALEAAGIVGGELFHRLLRPLVSGTFDVDRLDYIQRDGRNCGVPAGAIEWRRIVTKVLPCLGNHENDRGEPQEVVLLSNMRNQHVLDDFVFSLFQMYTQVYLHPKIVAMEEEIKRILKEKLKASKPFVLTLARHSELSDEGFLAILRKDFGLDEVVRVLRRDPGYRFKVASFSSGSGLADEYRRRGYTQLEAQDRPMLKDLLGVFLYHLPNESREPQDALVRAWEEVSPVAKDFRSISYTPDIWVLRSAALKN
jgi:HD superfamily phosphohydrolase